jgi:Fur family peroxide stress response transcriptional regulator
VRATKTAAPSTRRSSKQREAIAAYLETAAHHPTAEQVLRAVRKRIPALGLATVYRNLEALVRDGHASRTMHPEGARYDTRVDPHHHFTCSVCGIVENVDPGPQETKWIQAFQRSTGAAVHRVVADIRGVCADCRRR